mmetsp:Transcript_18281/g.23562  ORF Transcript_18281/g.23562 Transcript_18281/m.23562 type:complete len:495 (-) Transcript_18281:460-1944(-)
MSIHCWTFTFWSILIWAGLSFGIASNSSYSSVSKNISFPIDPLVAGLETSATLEAQRITNNRKQQGLPTYNWGLGASPFQVPEQVLETLRNNAHRKQYVTTDGISELSEVISSTYSVDDYSVSPDNVIVAAGLKQIVFDAQRAFGGEIIHIVPCWVSYEEQTLLLGKKPVRIYTKEVDDYKLQPEDLVEVLKEDPMKPRMIIFNNPVNPTGATYTTEELKSLARVISQFNVVIFADEVYLGLEYNKKTVSIASFLPYQTIRASSLSKKYSAGGWRLGWATFPDELKVLKDAMAAVGSSSYSCGPVPEQYAAVVALQETEEMMVRRYHAITVLSAVGGFYAQAFRELGIVCPEPKAAWYLFVSFEMHRETLLERGITTSSELGLQLLSDIGFVSVAGEAFGMPPHKFVLRVSFVDFDGEAAVQDVELMAGTGKVGREKIIQWTPKMYESLEMLKQWLGVSANMNVQVGMDEVFFSPENILPQFDLTSNGKLERVQ